LYQSWVLSVTLEIVVAAIDQLLAGVESSKDEEQGQILMAD